jgi:cellobiose phosphorylase
VDHTGGALICRGDPALNRITKYIPQLPASEFKGEGLYLRVRSGGGVRLFSPFFVPTLDPIDLYECHVGLGYTRIVSEFYGIRCEATIFVPPGGDRELRDFVIANRTEAVVEVDAIPVVEYTHPDAGKQLTNADWVPQTMQSRAVRERDGCLVLLQYPFMLRDTRVNYLTSNLPPSSFDTDRRAFLGDNEYGTWALPLALSREELGDTEAERGDNIGAILHRLGEIGPGASRRLITQLGQAASLEAALPSIRKYRSPEAVDEALAELALTWKQLLSRIEVATPDPAMDRMLNTHNPRQCLVTKTWSRYLSLYQLALGARSMGVRDTAQDLMGVAAHAPGQVPDRLKSLFQVQSPQGSAMHQFNPLTMEADAGDSREVEGAPRYYSDDHLWLILAATGYLKETGDRRLLDTRLTYYAPRAGRGEAEDGTLCDHLQRAIAFTLGDLGAHGLPRLGFADWNDTVNLSAGAESVFSALLFAKALGEMAELADWLGESERAHDYREHLIRLSEKVNQHAWDGSWYVAYFDASGRPLGSSRDQHGQIYLYPQAWAVLSGIAPGERARSAMEAVYRRLNTSRGIKLSAPGYDGFDPSIGGMTTYPPGAKENGGIFLHTNPWAIMAETALGNGDRAYEYYRQINPAAHNDRIEEYECEPYVYAQNILGDEHPQFGLARNSWLTGTASWALQAATQSILGLQPTYHGLRVDPCIPRHWDGFRATRQYREARYRIEVVNPEHVSRGVLSVIFDGQPISGVVLPIPADQRTYEVRVTLGHGHLDAS